jgi:hypothetical protein
MPVVVVCVAVSVTVSVVAACGSAGVAPRDWAKSVCGALTPWRAQIAALTGQVQQQMTGSTTPGQARDQLVSLLGGARDASEDARRKVVAAGAPAVDGGERIAGQFAASISAARDAYGHARDTVSTLDTGQAKPFYDKVSAAFEQLRREYAASALDTRQLDSAELRRAFDEVPECR